ncbi:MAG TPA: DUF4870 domain-containing protein [Candidatus Limnocylindrales bacterium]|nr:DUF4870 domain-containing protein [Candidatus Limnocylindrales bacterium]
METNVQYTAEDIQDNKFVAFLSYLGIFLLIPLLAKKDSPFCQFHAKQGLVLALTGVALSIVAAIPVLGWIVSLVGWLVVAILWIIGVVNVFSGQAKHLPLIGHFADKINI